MLSGFQKNKQISPTYILLDMFIYTENETGSQTLKTSIYKYITQNTPITLKDMLFLKKENQKFQVKKNEFNEISIVC